MAAIKVEPESMKSLHVRGMRKHHATGELTEITQGTAFIVEHLGRLYLLTNIHILTGHGPSTGEPIGKTAALPSTLSVWHNSSDGLGHWASVNYELYDGDGLGNWFEHPLSREWDMAAIQIGPKPELTYHTYSFTEEAANLELSPGSELSIVGFPFGTSSEGRFAIWCRGSVASDPDLSYEGRPAFLVDSRSRPGQSGSPVILKANHTARFANGQIIEYRGGNGPVQLFGIYSGRINEQSDLGIVWKSSALRQVVEAGQRTSRTYY